RRTLGDIAGAVTTLGFPRMILGVAENMGVCMGVYGKIAAGALALAASYPGGSVLNNVVAGRDRGDAQGFVRNFGSSVLAEAGLGRLPIQNVTANIAADGVRSFGLGAGYQGMNIGLGDRQADGTPHTVESAARSMASFGLGTAIMGMTATRLD